MFDLTTRVAQSATYKAAGFTLEWIDRGITAPLALYGSVPLRWLTIRLFRAGFRRLAVALVVRQTGPGWTDRLRHQVNVVGLRCFQRSALAGCGCDNDAGACASCRRSYEFIAAVRDDLRELDGYMAHWEEEGRKAREAWRSGALAVVVRKPPPQP